MIGLAHYAGLIKECLKNNKELNKTTENGFPDYRKAVFDYVKG